MEGIEFSAGAIHADGYVANNTVRQGKALRYCLFADLIEECIEKNTYTSLWEWYNDRIESC